MRRNRGLVIYNDPKTIEAEAFRILRTNLQFTSPDRELKTLLITSPGPGDGKSIVSSNLAVVWAKSAKNVLLVGTDLRRPTLHHIFPIPNAPGLTGYLTGQATLDEVILDSGIERLEIIPAGPIPPNPAELLGSNMMSVALQELPQRYDLVIFDATPLLAVTDAALLASRTDGTLLVITAGVVPKDVALQAKKILDGVQARLLGVVLNEVRFQNQKSYYYYYYSEETRRREQAQ